MTSKLTCALVALACLMACEKKDVTPADGAEKTTSAAAAPVAPPSAVAEAPPTASAAPAAEANANPGQAPVPADYEDQAQKDITPANLSSKLDELEKEINK